MIWANDPEGWGGKQQLDCAARESERGLPGTSTA